MKKIKPLVFEIVICEDGEAVLLIDNFDSNSFLLNWDLRGEKIKQEQIESFVERVFDLNCFEVLSLYPDRCYENGAFYHAVMDKLEDFTTLITSNVVEDKEDLFDDISRGCRIGIPLKELDKFKEVVLKMDVKRESLPDTPDMLVELKFAVGSMVFFMHQNKVTCGIVSSVNISKSKKIYRVGNFGYQYNLDFTDDGGIFKSKADLLASL